MPEYRAIYKCPLCGKVFENNATISNGSSGPTAGIYRQHECSDKIWGAGLLVGTYEVGANGIDELKKTVEKSEFGCLYRNKSLPNAWLGGSLTFQDGNTEYHIRSDYERWLGRNESD